MFTDHPPLVHPTRRRFPETHDTGPPPAVARFTGARPRSFPRLLITCENHPKSVRHSRPGPASPSGASGKRPGSIAGHECPGRVSGLGKTAKPLGLDAAKRSQSRLDRSSLRAAGPCLIGTALYGAVRRVVWDPGANYSRGPDSALLFSSAAMQCRAHHSHQKQ